MLAFASAELLANGTTLGTLLCGWRVQFHTMLAGFTPTVHVFGVCPALQLSSTSPVSTLAGPGA